MFNYLEELFNDWLEGWKILYEEAEKGNIVFIPMTPMLLVPVHKAYLAQLAKWGLNTIDEIKQSAKNFFNDWLEGLKIMDNLLDDPRKFVEDCAQRYIENSLDEHKDKVINDGDFHDGLFENYNSANKRNNEQRKVEPVDNKPSI